LAVSVDGQLPIEATVTVLERLRPSSSSSSDGPCVWLSTGDGCAALAVASACELADCSSPSAPAALLKAGLLCAKLVSLDARAASLEEQLRAQLNEPGPSGPSGPGAVGSSGGLASGLASGVASGASGLWVATRSSLPQGSGLGTSSILAGCLLAALAHAAHNPFVDPPSDGDEPSSDGPKGNVGSSSNSSRSTNNTNGASSVVHAVLMLEQRMTTGGGWQDQAGGCSPWAATISSSKPQLPLQVACPRQYC
jgi:fucokinase